MAPTVHEFEWDEWNIEHCPVAPETVDEVSNNAPAFFSNKKHRAAVYMMIGPDYDGQFWTIALAKTDRHGVWRPITGWPSEKGEIIRYHNAKPRKRVNGSEKKDQKS